MANDVRVAGIVSALVVALAAAWTAAAEEKRWRVRFEPGFVQAGGNDRHILTVHEVEVGTPPVTTGAGVRLDTESGVAPNFGVEYARGGWSYGMNYHVFLTSQDAGPLGAAAGGSVPSLEYEVSGISYVSNGPSEVLYYDTLTDTDMETWLLDLYATRSLVAREHASTRIQFGLRFADFDNDYHGVVGIENVEGSFLDASSNYPRMAGPLLGLVGRFENGNHEFEGYFGQSVVFGTADLSSSRSDFTGTPAAPVIDETQAFRVEHDESIPITELRFGWKYRVNDLVAAGAGIHSTVWWGVSVPPGVVPGAAGITALDENTIVFFGLTGVVEFSF